MASEALLDFSLEEKKRKLEESSLLSLDMDVDPASKRPCLATGSDSQLGTARQNKSTAQWQGPPSNWEEVHRQADQEESSLEQAKRSDWSHLPKTLRRMDTEPPPDTGPPKGRPWVPGVGQANPQLTGMVEDSNPLRGVAKPVRQPVPGLRASPAPPSSDSKRVNPFACGLALPSLDSKRVNPDPFACNPAPLSPDSNTSSRLSKRSFEEDDGATASGAGVSGVSHEGTPGKMTSQRPALKHRRILEEVSGSSEDEGEENAELTERSGVNERPAKGGSRAGWKEGGASRSADSGQPPQSSVESGRPLQSSVESGPPRDGGFFAGGRRQVFPPLPGMMKRSTSRADLTEEKRLATPSGGGVLLFERLTRGLPPAGERSGESVGSERSEGGRPRKDREELRRKELESLPPALRTSMFPLRAESGLSELEGRAPDWKRPLGVGLDNVTKQGLVGGGFKPRPLVSVGGLNSPGLETLGAARFVLPNGVKVTKAASDTLVPGPTLTDEAMHERTLHSVSITSAHAQNRKQTVEDEFEAYFAQMGISM